jgi:hypothetical protein
MVGGRDCVTVQSACFWLMIFHKFLGHLVGAKNASYN